MQTDNEVMTLLRQAGPATLAIAVATGVYLWTVSGARSYGGPFAIMVGIVFFPILVLFGVILWKSVKKTRSTLRPASKVRSTTKFEWDATVDDFK